MHVLLDSLDIGDIGESKRPKRLDHAVDQRIRHRGARGNTDRVNALEPSRIHFRGIIDAVSTPPLPQRFLGDFHQPH